MLVLPVRKDPLVQLVLRVHPALLVLEVREERRDLLVRLVLPAWEGDPETRDLLARLDLLGHLALLVCPDLLENLDRPGILERGEREGLQAHQE